MLLKRGQNKLIVDLDNMLDTFERSSIISLGPGTKIVYIV